MCQQCDDFGQHIQIKLPADLKVNMNRVNTAVAKKLLRITTGELQWSDYINCDLTCTKCDADYHLSCETYHGSGGSWGPK
ncbi:hypothetical protein DTL21_28080 [Bremerella cremea]|uniref:Uncharacterized protein n=1 Tax=Blastopirellula marina TaxID=124 RepID=A0A2S8F956_9BACT|nr:MULTISPECIES: hypothetical protein [Pirellulaceae]PQO28464.1 hypothetical protein C5Y83_28035 [Blastopirellula marina]RCS41833.1 hypothetical protein DTL21_28080 [Bremerella cremea]